MISNLASEASTRTSSEFNSKESLGKSGVMKNKHVVTQSDTTLHSYDKITLVLGFSPSTKVLLQGPQGEREWMKHLLNSRPTFLWM